MSIHKRPFECLRESGRGPTSRARILEAAAEVFAEHGYKNATVREICRAAGANVAAVNYYFGDKMKLYVEVLRSMLRAAYEKYPMSLGLPDNAPAEEKLHAFVKSFLLRIFDADNPVHCGRFMMREMLEPTGALDEVIVQEVAPKTAVLASIVQALAPCPLSDAQIRRTCFSIVGQCVFYKHGLPLIMRLHPEARFDEAELEQLARHITNFSLDGLRGFANPAPKDKA